MSRKRIVTMIPKRSDLRLIFDDEEIAINFVVENNVLYQFTTCDTCGYSPLKLYGRIWKCNRKQCRKGYSIFYHSFFSNIKLPINKVMEIAYYWLAGVHNTQIEAIMGVSNTTITHLTKYLRKLVSSNLDFVDMVIGGVDIIVEVDESKMGKVKYHRGHRVDGAWVLGGVERTPEKRIFLVEVPDRTEETLLSIIRTHVLPGSIIITDCFKSYINLQQYYTHLTVNHSLNFVDPLTGACTNTIEGTWNALKCKISPRNRTNSLDEEVNLLEQTLDDFLAEFQWKRTNKHDLWGAFIRALRETEYLD